MTNHSSNTIVNYIKIFRNLVINTLEDDDMIIGGKNIIVEIDESKFKDFWVVGGVERTKEQKCFFVVVEDRNTTTLRRIIKKHVKPESFVFTDSWKGYQLEGLNLIHRRVNHSRNVIETFGIHTNHIEGTWAGLKTIISEKNRGQDKIEKHLLEFVWRRKHRENVWQAFIDIIKNY